MSRLKSVDQETIRILNQKKILNLLYRNNKLTKQEISQRLNISIPTVISNSNELIEQGFLEEAGVAKSTGGRKPTILKFLPDSRYSFGVWITKDKVKIILTNLNFKIIHEIDFSMPEKLYDFTDVICKTAEAIEYLVNNFNISPDKILGIGFSLPGTVNEKELLLKNVPNLGFKNVSFKKFEDYFKFPIFIENEANASAYAETFINFNDVKNSLVFISITEGIGTGVVIANNVYKGFNKRAGEFGHMTIVKDGKRCNCGRKGCWELYASKKALLGAYREAFDDVHGNLDDFLKKSEMDLKAKTVLDTYIDFLAEGIKNIILTLDPKNILIGGEIFPYKDFIEKELIKKIFTDNSFYDESQCNVMFSNLGENAAVYGAALLPMENIFFLNDNVL
ncbi:MULTISPECIES: ROK family transcriptional regulator [Clostridium]|uniref:N-acetylglucosamine repressor n=1 Tax=Clostridium ragsdalei P11 TaxID=1353534 RepID=A0A1A6B445_9CLOT|nr:MULTISPECIES: ROK family transcriptional regulator [Clostridium]OBR97114.1 N-acetylglucosamine repressor [Clostridium ragsdalei P11]QXE20920.1 sugar kinase [Clostridium sp. 001]